MKAILYTSAALIGALFLGIVAYVVLALIAIGHWSLLAPSLDPHWRADPSQRSFYCDIVQNARTAATSDTRPNELNAVFIADSAPNVAAHTAALKFYRDTTKSLPTAKDLPAVVAAYPCPSNPSG